MKPSTFYSFAGIFSILTGVFSALAGVLYFLLPAEQKLGAPGTEILPSFAAAPTLLTLENLALGLVGVFGMGIVPALGRLQKNENDSWLRWLGNLAFVGYAVSAVGAFIINSRLPVIAKAYVNGDPSTQAALAVIWRTTLDPFGVWGFGAVGLWILFISIAALKSGAGIPRNLAYLGIAAAILHGIVPVGFLSHVNILFLAVAGGGMVVITLWYVWLGLSLIRATDGS